MRSDLGLAARALLEHGYGLEEPSRIVPAAIGFVADTYETDPEASRRLLSRMFDDDRFRNFGWEEVPAVCRKIAVIANADPAFGTEIYRQTYTRDVTEDRTTHMSSSQILSLTSSARQDYDMARYELGEFIPVFLDRHPSHAIEAVVAAVEGYVDRAHPIPEESNERNLIVAERNVRLRADLSHIWAHNPEDTHPPHDAEVLIVRLLERLRVSGGEIAIQLANLLIDKASLAVFWSRLFLAAVERNDELINLLIPFAMTEQFLVLPDTRKDAIDVVTKGYGRLTRGERQNFERQAFAFDFSEFVETERARDGFLHSLFSMIGHDALATEDARALVADTDQETARNERPFVARASSGAPEPYFWIPDLDSNQPANADLMEAIDSAKRTLALELDTQAPSGLTLDDAYRVLNRVEQSLHGEGVHPQLKINGEGVIGQACVRIIEQKLLPPATDDPATENFLRFLGIAANSAGPEVQDDTEDAFEQSPSWGSPAARLEAAQAVLDLVLQRPDLLPRVLDHINALLVDAHPAVRMQAGLYLIRIWDLDRGGFWQRLEARLAEETNLSALEHLINKTLSRILHVERARVESLILALLRRFPDDNERSVRLRKVVSDLLAILWVTYEQQAARSVIVSWIADPARHHDELTRVLFTMRGAFVAGLVGQKEQGADARRRRALDLAQAIVEAVSDGLARYDTNTAPNDSDRDGARKFAQLLDAACRELYFSTGASKHNKGSSRPPSVIKLDIFFREATPILQRIGDRATPHTVYYLLQLLEFLLPIDPERAFDLAAHVLRRGGSHTGFQFESLGVGLVVRLVGVFLADHKEIFENEERQTALTECLEIFMEAGWPPAQRLLYRLPELLQ